jgi:hypothetical protein
MQIVDSLQSITIPGSLTQTSESTVAGEVHSLISHCGRRVTFDLDRQFVRGDAQPRGIVASFASGLSFGFHADHFNIQ